MSHNAVLLNFPIFVVNTDNSKKLYSDMTPKNGKEIFVLVLLACLFLYACTQTPSGFGGKTVLRPLGKGLSAGTQIVSDSLPLMRQQQKSLYQIKKNYDVFQMIQIIRIDSVFSPEYRIIPLETIERSLIGNIGDLFKDDSLLILTDYMNGLILAFDLNGKFLHQIGSKGHASNEYTNMLQVAFDAHHKRLCVLDGYSDKLVFYDFQGKHLGSEPLYFRCGDIAFWGDKRFLLTLPYVHEDYGILNSFKLTVTDEKGMPECGILCDPGFPKDVFGISLGHSLHANPDGVFYMDILTPDTIWRIRDDECVPFLVADFGEPFTTAASYCEMTDESYCKRINQIDFLRDDFVFTKDFGYVGFRDCAIVNLNTGNYLAGRLSGRLGRPLRNFLEFAYESDIWKPAFLYDWERNQIAKVWPADELVRYLEMMRDSKDGEDVYQSWPQSDRDILERLTPEDNPVIVVATLKEF